MSRSSVGAGALVRPPDSGGSPPASSPVPIRAYATAASGLCVLLLALFGLAHLFDVPVLTDDSPELGSAGLPAAALSFALLAGDVVLPVPSSGVMLANGALFGPVGGIVLSLAGSAAAALLALAIGRRGGALLERLVSPEERARFGAAIEQHGALAIVVTRPVPVIAETTAILAGAAGMPLRRLAVAAAIGSLPPAVAYGIAGASADSVSEGVVVFAGTLVLAAGFWLADRRRRPRPLPAEGAR